MAIAVWQAGIAGIVLTSAAVASAITTTAGQGKASPAPVVATSAAPATAPPSSAIPVLLKVTPPTAQGHRIELTGRQFGDNPSVTVESPMATYTFAALSLEKITQTTIAFDAKSVPAGSYTVSVRDAAGRATAKLALVIKSK